MLKKKAVDDIMGGDDAWANVDKTQVYAYVYRSLNLGGCYVKYEVGGWFLQRAVGRVAPLSPSDIVAW